MKIQRHIPNFITLLNLLSGCLSIYFAGKGELHLASWMIFLAAGFDFLDGFSARLLKAYSKIGGELDSLADVVSFGVAPAFILLGLVIQSHGRPEFMVGDTDILPFMVFVLPLFTALRLAKFNLDERQTSSFLGLPSPASGLLIASLPLIKTQLYEGQSLFYMVVTNAYFYLGMVWVLSLLMVSEMPLFALKFKSYRVKSNEIRYILLIISIILLATLQFVAIPFIVLTYLFLSLVVFLTDL